MTCTNIPITRKIARSAASGAAWLASVILCAGAAAQERSPISGV